MLFCSMTFIYVFLPILFAVYLFVRHDLRNYVLLIASLIFYAWGEPRYLIIMLFSILCNYIFGIVIENSYKSNSYHKIMGGGKPLFFLVIGIVANLAILSYFKYFSFLIENLNLLFKSNIDIVKVVLPIGISFYTFQSISYLMDVYRQEVKAQRDLPKLALYITLFPQLIAGPIVKYHDISQQIESRYINFDNITCGIKRFVIGLSKKMLIANPMGAVADKIFAQNADSFSPGIAWMGAICYSLQLFFDFSGYSDMAIGLGKIFGFTFKENFNYPYISKSISEFWRRWHISLSTWFKEYLYIPLGGNKKGNRRTYLNLGIVFLLTGLWHGAAWTFVFWGIWHGLFIIIERYFGLNKDNSQKPLYQRVLLHLYCILVFVVGWVFFRSPDLQYGFNYVLNMFCVLPHQENLYKIWYYVDVIPIITFIFAIFLTMPLGKVCYEKASNNSIGLWIVNLLLYGLFILSTAEIATTTYNPFIYFRF